MPKLKKKSLIFIVNCNSSQGSDDSFLAKLKLGLKGYSYVVHFPDSVEAASTICKEIVSGSCHAVIIVGGDGTFSCNVPHLIKKKIPVFVFPTGKSNQLAKYLGCKGEIEQLQNLLDSNSFAPIDLISVNEAIFATVGGIGFGADLSGEVAAIRQRRYLKRFLSFFENTLLKIRLMYTVFLGNHLMQDVKITADGFSNSYKTAGIFVCNQPQKLGDAISAPMARNDDGKLEVFILLDTSKSGIFRSLLQMKRGFVPQQVVKLTTSEIVIESTENRPLDIYGDGEKLVNSVNATFKVLPSAINVYIEKHVVADDESATNTEASFTKIAA